MLELLRLKKPPIILSTPHKRGICFIVKLIPIKLTPAIKVAPNVFEISHPVKYPIKKFKNGAKTIRKRINPIPPITQNKLAKISSLLLI